jgi:hypothetical protein
MREVICKANAAREDEQNAEDGDWPGSLHAGRRDSTRGGNGRLQKKRGSERPTSRASPKKMTASG